MEPFRILVVAADDHIGEPLRRELDQRAGDRTPEVRVVVPALAQTPFEQAAGAETHPVDQNLVAGATFCHPQVASVGLTEAAAKEAGHDVKVGKLKLGAVGGATVYDDKDGLVKLVVDSKYGEILGLHMIGPDVTELLPELTLAQMWDLTAEEVARNVHAHPTLSEALKEVAHGISGHMINF